MCRSPRWSQGMSSNLRPAVLFDVDGTLVDSNYLHALSWSRALRDAGEWAPMNAIHRLVGMGGDQLVTELLGHECLVAQDALPDRYEELKSDMVAYPYAADLLRRVHELGPAVVLATSAPRLSCASCVNSSMRKTPLTPPPRLTMSKHRSPTPRPFSLPWPRPTPTSARTVAVGDSVWDIQRHERLASVASHSDLAGSASTN